MSEDLDDLVENLKEPSVWIRILFMLAFGVVLYFVLAPVIFVIMLAQALFVLLTGESNYNLRQFSATLSKYIFETLNFLTYNSDAKPFPFADLPEVEAEESEPTAPVKKSTARKRAPKKKAAKKSTAKKASKKSDATGNGASKEGQDGN